MRSAPLGAYFADDVSVIPAEAALAASVTHTHREAIDGAVAVALAAAAACNSIGENKVNLLEFVIAQLPSGLIQDKLLVASRIPVNSSIQDVAAQLGNGRNSLASETVPLCLWLASTYSDRFEQALWAAASAGGDMDTICAIVGGIVASKCGPKGIPFKWTRNREPLPECVYEV